MKPGVHGPRRPTNTHESSVQVTDREPSIVDCLDRPDLSGGVAEVARGLDAGDGDFDWARLTEGLPEPDMIRDTEIRHLRGGRTARTHPAT